MKDYIMKTGIDMEINNICVDEHGGNHGSMTNIERLWDSLDGPYQVRTRRNLIYATHSHMSSTMLQHELIPFSIDPQKLPDKNWIRENAINFIRNESPNLLCSDSYKPINNHLGTRYIDISFLEDFINASDWSTKISIPVTDNCLNEEVMASSIYNILINKDIVGTNKNARYNNKDTFLKQIIPILKRKARLMLILPGLPFKDQNILRTPCQYDADSPDMCEISFMVKLNNIVESIYQVCPYGTDIVILSDGELYADIFNVDVDKVNKYIEKVIDYRNKLNFHGSISIINMKKMIDRASPNQEAWQISHYIQTQIDSLLQNDDNFVNDFSPLIQGIKWNLNTKIKLKDISKEICFKILKNDINELSSEYHDIWNDVHINAKKSAIKYCSINLMLRWTQLLYRFFPDAIRATMHAKENQFALSSDSFPWNGVAYSEKWPESLDDIKVRSYYSIANKKNLNLIYFKGTNYPCCFTSSNYKTKNIDLARKVMSGPFSSSDWGGFNLHEFKDEEYGDFFNLAQGDPNFAWSRTEQSEEHWKQIFEFRKQHYHKYDFGVLGVWKKDNKSRTSILIGQFGLQVLDEEHDEIEIVAFLGKNYTGQGYGTVLMNRLLMRCKKYGLNTLYAVVRLNNDVSIKYISKFSGRAVEMKQHYNYKGIKYKITI